MGSRVLIGAFTMSSHDWAAHGVRPRHEPCAGSMNDQHPNRLAVVDELKPCCPRATANCARLRQGHANGPSTRRERSDDRKLWTNKSFTPDAIAISMELQPCYTPSIGHLNPLHGEEACVGIACLSNRR